MGKLIVLFTVVPLGELYLLLFIAEYIGFWTTVFLVLATGLLGAFLAKTEGLRVLHNWQSALREGRIPEEGVIGSLLVLVGGVLLVTPGVLTDLVGLSLLIPYTRQKIAMWIRTILERSMQEGRINVIRIDQTTNSAWNQSSPPTSMEYDKGEVVDTPGETVEEKIKKGPSQ